MKFGTLRATINRDTKPKSRSVIRAMNKKAKILGSHRKLIGHVESLNPDFHGDIRGLVRASKRDGVRVIGADGAEFLVEVLMRDKPYQFFVESIFVDVVEG